MTRTLPFLLCAAAGLAVASADAKSHPIESRYTKLKDCKEVAHAPLGEDWVFVRCAGLGKNAVWWVNTDSARAQIGFGPKPNTSGIFETGRDQRWPIEWRGTRRNGRFEPFAVILRLRRPDEQKSFLAVYRLRSDGTSCIVGSTEWTELSNKGAREIADRTSGTFRCEAEPHLPELD